MSGLDKFLLFFTLWIVIIAGLIYLIRRLTAPPRNRGSCCMEVPCSAKCADWHQKARDRMDVQYDRIVSELGALVTAGHELESGPTGRPESGY
jgi:hypothetical protein